MEKVNIKNTKELIDISIDSIIKVCFGDNDKLAENYRELHKKLVNKTKVIKSRKTILVNNINADGACKISNKKTEGFTTYEIIVQQFKKELFTDNREYIIHACIHEHFHFTTNLLNEIFSKHINNWKIDNNVKKKTMFGLIKTRDKETGEPCGRNNYFKMFNETMMDIMATITKSTFVDGKCNVEDILSGENLGVPTGYTQMVPLTLLFISAFSNNPNPEYSKKIMSGKGIVRDETITSKGQKLFTNDFITNALCDPLILEEEFDKYTDAGNFEAICEMIDIYYFDGKINKDLIKLIMKDLSKFVSNKLNDKIQKQIISTEEALRINDQFNIMFNKTLLYYGITFTTDDYNDISKNIIYLNQMPTDGVIKKVLIIKNQAQLNNNA